MNRQLIAESKDRDSEDERDEDEEDISDSKEIFSLSEPIVESAVQEISTMYP